MSKKMFNEVVTNVGSVNSEKGKNELRNWRLLPAGDKANTLMSYILGRKLPTIKEKIKTLRNCHYLIIVGGFETADQGKFDIMITDKNDFGIRRVDEGSITELQFDQIINKVLQLALEKALYGDCFVSRQAIIAREA